MGIWDLLENKRKKNILGEIMEILNLVKLIKNYQGNEEIVVDVFFKDGSCINAKELEFKEFFIYDTFYIHHLKVDSEGLTINVSEHR